MILTNYPERVETLLLLLTRHLDRYGLRVNQKKVHVWKVSELEAHRCRTIQAIFAHKRDNQNSKLVRDFVEKYLQIPQSELENSWNEGLPLLNRLVFSNLESLPKQLLKRMVKRFIAENYLLRADHKKIARVAALAQQSGEQERMNENLTRLIGKCVHNAFHHEVRAFALHSKDRELEMLCSSRLNALATLMSTAEHPELMLTSSRPANSGSLLRAQGTNA